MKILPFNNSFFNNSFENKSNDKSKNKKKIIKKRNKINNPDIICFEDYLKKKIKFKGDRKIG